MGKIAGLLFAVCFLICATVSILAFSYLIASLLIGFVRIFKPNFAKYLHPEDLVKRKTQESVKKVAIDYILQARRELQKQMEAPRKIRLGAALKSFEPAEESVQVSKNEWSIADIVQATIPQKTIPNLEDKAEYSLVQFPEGPSKPARYLCQKISERGRGLRVAFASLPSKSIRMDFQSAARLSAVIPNSFVVPQNSAARILERQRETERCNATA
jgi:hypothetical protein